MPSCSVSDRKIKQFNCHSLRCIAWGLVKYPNKQISTPPFLFFCMVFGNSLPSYHMHPNCGLFFFFFCLDFLFYSCCQQVAHIPRFSNSWGYGVKSQILATCLQTQFLAPWSQPTWQRKRGVHEFFWGSRWLKHRICAWSQTLNFMFWWLISYVECKAFYVRFRLWKGETVDRYMRSTLVEVSPCEVMQKVTWSRGWSV